MQKMLMLDQCSPASKEIIEVIKGKRNAVGAMAIWWPVYFGAIRSAQDAIDLCGVSIATAKRWISTLRRAGLVRTIEGDAKIVAVLGCANLIHCNVQSVDGNTTTNIHTNGLTALSNEKNLSIVQEDYLINKRAAKIEELSIKVAQMFNKCKISNMAVARIVSKFEIQNVLDYWLADQAEINEALVLAMAAYCRRQYENPDLRPVLDNGQPDVIQDIVAYYAGCLAKRLQGKVYWIQVEKATREVSPAPKSPKAIERELLLHEDIQSTVGELKSYYGPSDWTSFEDLFAVADRYHDRPEEKLRLAETLLRATRDSSTQLRGRTIEIYTSCLVRAVETCARLKKPFIEYLLKVYITECDKSGLLAYHDEIRQNTLHGVPAEELIAKRKRPA